MVTYEFVCTIRVDAANITAAQDIFYAKNSGLDINLIEVTRISPVEDATQDKVSA
jgi:hypothetical protein